MPCTVSILPLPGSSTLLRGYYGLEQCCVQGLVRIQHEPGYAIRRASPLRIKSLTVTLCGRAFCLYKDATETLETTRREQLLLHRSVDLLAEVETIEAGGILEIPFDIQFPEDPDPSSMPPPPPGTSPSPHLLPPSMAFLGHQSSAMHSYQGRINYDVIATLTEVSSSIFRSAPPIRTASVSLHPFRVYDPRLLPILLHPDIRRWRSAPDAVPVEYDIEVGSIAMGPGDPLRFAYRMVVANESARKGVRLKKISLVLREHHVVGEQRCQGRRDCPEYPIERRGTRVSGMTEILRWEQVEQLPDTNEGEFELSDIGGKAISRHTVQSRSEKLPLPRPGLICRGGDGLYAESETVLYIPTTGGIAPSTAKIVQCPPVPPDGELLPAHVEVRHSLQVSIEFIGADKIVMESGCVLSSVGRENCDTLLEECPDLCPTLDYDKIVGGDIWVPEYASYDELAEQVKRIPEDWLEAMRAVTCGTFSDASIATRKLEADVQQTSGPSNPPSPPSPTRTDPDVSDPDSVSPSMETGDDFAAIVCDDSFATLPTPDDAAPPYTDSIFYDMSSSDSDCESESEVGSIAADLNDCSISNADVASQNNTNDPLPPSTKPAHSLSPPNVGSTPSKQPNSHPSINGSSIRSPSPDTSFSDPLSSNPPSPSQHFLAAEALAHARENRHLFDLANILPDSSDNGDSDIDDEDSDYYR